jgi:hypothetical protein
VSQRRLGTGKKQSMQESVCTCVWFIDGMHATRPSQLLSLCCSLSKCIITLNSIVRKKSSSATRPCKGFELYRSTNTGAVGAPGQIALVPIPGDYLAEHHGHILYGDHIPTIHM